MYKLLITVCFVAAAAPAFAQSWTRRLVEEVEHDFGSSPVGVVREHRFKLTNPFRDLVRVKDVHTSCGCLSASLAERELAPGASAPLVVRWQARAGAGPQTATVGVTLDKPFKGELQLHVQGRVEEAVVVEPALCDFGTVQCGESRTCELRVTNRHDPAWRIEQLLHAQGLSTEFVEHERTISAVTYLVRVRLPKETPAGYVRETLGIVGTPGKEPPLAIDIRGCVRPELSLSPASLSFGAVAPPAEVERRLVLRSTRPLRIQAILCDDPRLAFGYSDDALALHIITARLKVGEARGTLFAPIRIRTDTSDACLECTAHALIQSQ